MCGIVGAVVSGDASAALLDGLARLEYRGYDSAGIVLIGEDGELSRLRRMGKIRNLRKAFTETPLAGGTGIAHTRWATHGKPREENAHPHICNESVALVHNGIIENYQQLKATQLEAGYRFTSDTDSEVIVHQLHHFHHRGDSLLESVRSTVKVLKGAYALAVVSRSEPERIVVARSGSALVIGIGDDGHYIASDISALLPVTQRFIYLEEGDIASIERSSIAIYDHSGAKVDRPLQVSQVSASETDLQGYRHHMIKEIYQQPAAITETLEGRLGEHHVLEEIFGTGAKAVFNEISRIHIVACGTSYHAGLLARYGFEALAGIPCRVEVASEYRYRRPVIEEGTLFIAISQSGETADTLAALRLAKARGYCHTLAVCNVPESSLARESDLFLMTRAGPEIGVASTKAFTTQLVALLLLIMVIGRRFGVVPEQEAQVVAQLRSLPATIEQLLQLEPQIAKIAERFGNMKSALFLGRGPHFPVALEGALKLKEISYVHAEGYPAGELKHGPLALVDGKVPIVAVAPNNSLLDKLKANLHEVRARGGELIIFADAESGFVAEPGMTVINIAPADQAISPIVYTIPLQLLAYHVALIKGTDIDQPRNLAKSVTVE